jgi:hypothetical protein
MTMPGAKPGFPPLPGNRRYVKRSSTPFSARRKSTNGREGGGKSARNHRAVGCSLHNKSSRSFVTPRSKDLPCRRDSRCGDDGV